MDLRRAIDPDQRQHCIDQCLECHMTCLEFAAELACEEDADAGELAALLEDCAEICLMHASSLVRRSVWLNRPLTELCAEICERCAAACSLRGAEGKAGECQSVCDVCSESCLSVSEARVLQ